VTAPLAGARSRRPTPVRHAALATFSFGQLQSRTVGARGCGTNRDGEPAIRISRTDNVFLGAERGIGMGSDLWRGSTGPAGRHASACALEYRGQPNATSGTGAAGGDIDIAVGSAKNAQGHYPVYVASLNGGSVSVARSADDAQSFDVSPFQVSIPGDDREWIAAYGSSTSLLSFHDMSTNNIDVLRSDSGGLLYAQASRAIPDGDPKAGQNQLGNLVIDHRNTAGTASGPTGQPGFWAYQSFVAPSALGGSKNNEAFVSVSNDGGFSFAVRAIPCSRSRLGLDHAFPNVSVAPNGRVWAAWSDDRRVFTAVSSDHGAHWSCSRAVRTTSRQAIYPWLAATSRGVDLVYYGAPTAPGGRTPQTFSVHFAQNRSSRATGWGRPQRLVTVHRGPVCQSGFACMGGRQLLDDFGVETDSHGQAHIAYSRDAPRLGGPETATGYATQRTGPRVGGPNN